MSEAPSSPAAGSGEPAAMPWPVPYVLMLPTGSGELGPIEWPGADGQPTWAVPVTVPAGTRGFAFFVPIVPSAGATAGPDAPAGLLATAPPQTPRETPTPTAPVPAGPPSVASGDPAAAQPGAAPAIAPATPDAAPTTPVSGPTPAAVPTPAAAATPVAAPTRVPAPASMPERPVTPAEPPRVGPAQWPEQPQWVGRWAGQSPVLRPPPFLGSRWPGPEPERGWTVPAAVLAGALGAAVFVPLRWFGIGWLLGGLVLVAAVVATVWRRTATQPRVERVIRLGWAVSALALLTVLAFRNAWWLLAFSVLGALGCLALAIIGGRQVRSILYSLVAAPFAALRGLPWVGRHLQGRRADGTPVKVVGRIIWSLVVTVVVLVVFGTLLTSADAAFSDDLRRLVPTVDGGSTAGWLLLFVVGGLIAVAATYALSAPPDLSTLDRPGTTKLRPVEWALPIGGLVLLFGGFVIVQFTVLFRGRQQVVADGLTYAEYARSGFWQLFTVTVLTVAVLGGVTRWARRDRPADGLLLRILLGLLCLLSIVIVVSAISRMVTYQQVYSFTGERIFVMAFEILLGTIFVLIMLAGIWWRGAWIPRLTLGLTVVMLLTLAIMNPEAMAAQRNIERYLDTGKIDAWYLRALSADATPALTQLPDAVRRCTLSWIAADLTEPTPWNAWNLGRQQARAALDKLPPGAIGNSADCRSADQFDLPKTR